MGLLPKKPYQEEEGWLLTYADMITLLMCLFLIMLTVSVPKVEKMQQVKSELMKKFSNRENSSTPFASVFSAMTSVVENLQLNTDIFVRQTPNGAELEMRAGSFFAPASAEINEEGVAVLDQIADSLSGLGQASYVISVEGHTDDTPIGNEKYPSNWELSSARASSVVRHLIDSGTMPERLRAIGYGDTEPKLPNRDTRGNPIPDNQAANRRIIIKLERPS